ncbi:MAG: tetratricopeptide repeat protein [Chloroflexota bacterium]
MGKDLRVFIAEFLQKINQHEGAIGLLEQARALAPEKQDVLLALGRIYYQKGEFRQSIEIYKKIEKLYPGNQHLKWELGTALLATSQFDAALPYFQHFESRAIPNDQVLALLGIVLLNLDRGVEAENYLRNALEITPWNADACKGMLDLLRRTGRFDEIIPFLDQYIQKTPDQFPGYGFMAIHLHNDRFDPKASLEWYQLGLGLTNYRHAKKYELAYIACQGLFETLVRGYVNALVVTNQSDRALRLIQSERRKRAFDSQPYLHLINYYLSTEDYISAEKLTRKSIVSHNLPESRLMMALALMRQNRVDDAFSHAKYVTEKDPLLLYAWLVLGDIQICQKKWQDAIYSIQKFLSLQPYDPDGLYSLATCYWQMNQLEKAIFAFETLVKISPLNADAWVELGEVYNKVGRVGDSVAALERALTFERLPEERKQETLALLATVKRDASQ